MKQTIKNLNFTFLNLQNPYILLKKSSKNIDVRQKKFKKIFKNLYLI
jgi:hypothetical protein